MLFNKTAQKPNSSQENTYISKLADEYIDLCFRNLDEQKVKDSVRGKFADLKYTLSGFDSANLGYKEKLNLIEILFNLYKEEKGMLKAVRDFENLGIKLKDRLGVVKAFEDGIKVLPKDVFKSHKVDVLDKDELKKQLKETLLELENARENVNIDSGDSNKDLLAQKDILETILHSISDGVFALNKRGEIIVFNKAMEELTGFDSDEAKMNPAEDIIRLFDSSDPLEIEKYCDLLEIDKNVKSYENEKITLVSRNGEKKYVRMKSSAINQDNVDIGCVVTLKDVTKDIELDTMKLDFVSMAAHELRTPLTALRGYLSFLNDELKEKLEDPYGSYVDKSVVSADRLHVLIENLLNISRIERGKLVLEKNKQKWIPLVKSVVEQFKQNAEAAGIELTFAETPSKIPDVVVDKTMITEVISNLLDNAIRYTGEGGRITVFVEESEDKVVTHVKDTGIGIPRASIPHLFKKFYRVSTVLKEGKKGTGLGLFISKEIVKLHKGDIWVESVEGEGSTFSFSLPVEDREETYE